MSDVAIRIESLSKKYRIGTAKQRHDRLSDRLLESLRSVFSRNGQSHETANTIWALKDVSLEVRHSEVVGFIGRNGAGKSTLLKILSRITPPTTGRAEIHGRVGSLLEVGTGFDRDLTGRENVYLNGAILGMRKVEIDRKFEEIVAFSEVEKFIDTPVKWYSSGMYVRLAFAVAAHLEPEILIVDEVLAVGDSRFQEKCLNKMGDLRQAGRTVLFVSHNMSAITRLCERAVLFDQGKVQEDGPSHRVVGEYLSNGAGLAAIREWPDPAHAPGGSVARLRAARIRTLDGRIAEAVDIREAISIDIEYEVIEGGHALMPCIQIDNQEGIQLIDTVDTDPAWRKRPRPIGRYVSTVHIPGNFFSEGRLCAGVVLLTLHPERVQFAESHVVSFQVLEGLEVGTARGDWHGNFRSVIRPAFEWTTQFTPDRGSAHTERGEP